MKVARGQFVVYYPQGFNMDEDEGHMDSNANIAAKVADALRDGASIACPSDWRIDYLEPIEVKAEHITEEMIEKVYEMLPDNGGCDFHLTPEQMAAAINVFLQEPKEV